MKKTNKKNMEIGEVKWDRIEIEELVYTLDLWSKFKGSLESGRREVPLYRIYEVINGIECDVN